MLNKLVVAIACVIFPTAAFAAPIVTFEASGALYSSYSQFPGFPNVPQAPPLGTAYSVQLKFDPDVRVLTPTAPAGAPCYMTPVTGTFDLGGAAYSLSGSAFTCPTARHELHSGRSQPTIGVDRVFSRHDADWPGSISPQ